MRYARAALLALILLAVIGQWGRPLRGLVLAVVRFPLTVVERVIHTVAWLPDLPSLARENAALRQDLITLRLQFAALSEQLHGREEAARLRVAFGDAGTRGQVLSVLGRTLMPTEHTVILNRGASDGVLADGVLVDLGGLMGRVIEIHPTTSLGMLLTDPESRVGCRLERSRELGLLVGTGGRFCELLYLDLDADVAVDDRVVTAGVGGPFPQGIAVGTVARVSRDPGTGTTKVWVRPSARLGRAGEVLYFAPGTSGLEVGG